MPGDIFQGDPRSPKPKQALKDIAQGLRLHLGDITSQIFGQTLPAERALLGARQEIAPQEAQLEADIYRQIFPQYAQADLANLQGAGGQAVVEADFINEALKRIADPEFFQTRANTSGRVNEMLDAGANLTGGEISSIERGLNRQFQGRGIADVPSNLSSIQSAMSYGSAGREKLGQALQFALGSLPNFQTRGNTNVLGQSQSTTARAMPKTGFSGDIGGASQALGSQVLGGAQAQQLGQQNINSQRRTVQDFSNQALTAVGSAAGGAGGACCFIFLESYNGLLPWFVRYWRDRYYEREPQVAKGYKRMARWLVPLMQRSNIAKELVNTYMVLPITQYGGYLSSIHGFEFGKNSRKTFNFWMKVWKLLGKI